MNAAPEPPTPLAQWLHAQSQVGQSVARIDTPALVVDLDAMERNLAHMAAYARAHKLRLRPHAKMHKSAELARLQMAHGAVGVCVQKTDEAIALALAGVTDITITNQVIAQAKLERLARAVRELPTRFGIAVDNAVGVTRLVEALTAARVDGEARIDVLVEIDVGQGRCGVPPGEAAVDLVRLIAQHPVLRFGGLQAYHGGAQHRRDPAERARAIAEAAWGAALTRERLLAAGFEVPLITGAGTGTFTLETASRVWGELQVGSYLFMDADYARNEAAPLAPLFEHALFLKTQVMSRGPQHAVCDAGHKSHAIDSGMPMVWSPPGLVFANGGDEHGVLRAAHAGHPLPSLGDTVWLVPGHCDPTVNLHDVLLGVRGGLVEGTVERVIRVDARGAVR
ncbi:DSD1 family PLP-dependent enzyme [Hydrogenophaga sp. BPS33]|uniref:DSD1 family PLP-dependent enzyme n=1 Tax=Hydrogenophaga sp. BPS33 TaxID=2651974 RepID=UPI00131FED31|nr:DSD1 family PLP-dependent enzyme [Hydrogenophaga sp. BPS33]QHE84200.1 DSD1 family PLP-dependent enzyme [Hydrogenophaga sp. BPS33]